MMDLTLFLENAMYLHLLLAGGLGALIGIERELAGKDPGLRTFTMISLGSCIFTLLSVDASKGVFNADPARISAQIISGVGFLGAGVIFRSRKGNGVKGLTTASLIWLTAGIGMAVGFNRIDIATVSTLIAIILNVGLGKLNWFLRKRDLITDEQMD